MANIRLGNTFYIDTQYTGASDELALKDVRIAYVIVTPTAANGRVVLSDGGLGIKADLRRATANESNYPFDFSNEPIRFSTSIRPTTLANAVVTCVIIPPGT